MLFIGFFGEGGLLTGFDEVFSLLLLLAAWIGPVYVVALCFAYV